MNIAIFYDKNNLSDLKVGIVYETNADFDNHEIITYRVAAVNGNAESLSAHYTVNHATELQLDILRRSLEGKNTPQFASRVR